MCDIGRRLWQRAYVDGNGGNIAIKVGEDIALCTPTLVSKGFMKPSDMCLVDFEGNQLAGHQEAHQRDPDALADHEAAAEGKATCHCHPPYSTGFAVAGLVPPDLHDPEYEVFASVAVADYRTPGTPEMGKLVADLVEKHNTILMANHGVVSWSHNNGRGRLLQDGDPRGVLPHDPGHGAARGSAQDHDARTAPGPPQDQAEPRHSRPAHGLKECELCDNSDWRPGVVCGVPAKTDGDTGPALDPEAEAVVKAVTEQLLSRKG
jgi:L-fuculose-phosphate aldolase